MRAWHWPVLLGWLLSSVLSWPVYVAATTEPSVTIVIKTLPHSDLATTLQISDKAGLAQQILSSPAREGRQASNMVRATLHIGTRTFVYDIFNRLYEPEQHRELMLTQQLEHTLNRYVTLTERAHYGQPTPWSEVRKHFRRYSFATVTDLETGLSFAVQRRAGSKHADVQPLTLRDTKIMKQIYGTWSWRRRAILVTIDGKQYAASMNGMPHGAGAIRGNGFPGHFCIHFTGSTTHRQREVDPGHAYMIEKASGLLQRRLLHSSPEELARYLLISLRERDHGAIPLFVSDPSTLPVKLAELTDFRYEPIDEALRFPDDLTAVIPVTVSYSRTGKGKSKQVWNLVLARNSWFDRWYIKEIVIN